MEGHDRSRSEGTGTRSSYLPNVLMKMHVRTNDRSILSGKILLRTKKNMKVWRVLITHAMNEQRNVE